MAGSGGNDGGPPEDWPKELMEELRQRPRADPLWRLFRQNQARTMIGVLHRALLEEDFRSSGRRPPGTSLHPLERAALRDDEQSRTDLVHESVVRALELFEARLRAGTGWRADKGASVTTYVVSGALFALADQLSSWRRARRLDRCEPRDPATLPLTTSRDPESIVVSVEEVLRIVARLGDDPLLREMVLDRVDTNDSWTLIARRHGTTRKAVERRLDRFRKLGGLR